MAALDDLRALADSLPGEAKPVAAEVVDVVAAIAHTLEDAGVKVPAPVSEAVQVAEDATDDSETEGSAVFDAAAAGSQEPAAAPPATEPTAAELQDQIQALQVQLADKQKTQLSTEPLPPVPPVEP